MYAHWHKLTKKAYFLHASQKSLVLNLMGYFPQLLSHPNFAERHFISF